MSRPLLKLEGFSKTFRSNWTLRPIRAVHNLSLEVYPGESFGFLGHNGAGKTTTIKTIVGLIKKSKGKLYVDGCELPNLEAKKKIGYLPEHPYFYDHLTVWETLDFFGTLYGIKNPLRKKKVNYILERVGLTPRRTSIVRSLSKGWQQRLGLAQAILNDPKLLLLDEPFSGLDPLGRLEVRNLILELNRNGTTVFLSSHILSDVEDICNRISIMARGELKTVFYLEEAASIFGEEFELRLRFEDEQDVLRGRFASVATKHIKEDTLGGVIDVFCFKQYDVACQAMMQAQANALKIESFRSNALSLEDIFMKITAEANQPASNERRVAPSSKTNHVIEGQPLR